MVNSESSRKPQTIRLRFPRPFAQRIAATVNGMWRVPKFIARNKADSTEFAFSLPFSIPAEMKRRDLVPYYRLFPQGRKGWSKTLVKAYRHALHDGRPVKKEIGKLLQKVLIQALQDLLTNTEVFEQKPEQVRAEQDMLRKGVIKTGPRPDERKVERTAKRLARRYDELHPEVKKIRDFVKLKEDSVGDVELRRQVEQTFRVNWVSYITRGKALENLLPIPAHESRVQTLSSDGWTPRQLTVGIIVCEEKARDPKSRFSAGTIYEKYIIPGHQLIEKPNNPTGPSPLSPP